MIWIDDEDRGASRVTVTFLPKAVGNWWNQKTCGRLHCAPSMKLTSNETLSIVECVWALTKTQRLLSPSMFSYLSNQHQLSISQNHGLYLLSQATEISTFSLFFPSLIYLKTSYSFVAVWGKFSSKSFGQLWISEFPWFNFLPCGIQHGKFGPCDESSL